MTGSHDHPIVPKSTYFTIFALLIILLVATVAVAEFNFGALNLPLAIGIATAKALLIVIYFMHLKYAIPLTKVVAFASIVWLFILFVFFFSDYATRSAGPL